MDSDVEVEAFIWTDTDFKKGIDFKQYITDNRLKKQSEICILYCEVCGEKFAISRSRGRPSKYCCEECNKEARKQQNRNKSHRWYHKHKHELDEKRRWGLGSGTLGPHMHKDINKEESAIKKEMRRLRISNKMY